MRTGIANLPLHQGSVPRWLFEKMARLARQISLAIICEFSPQIFLTKISDPFWFQSFGACLGFDWHSSGLTTTVCGALKQGLWGLEKDTGLFIAGGKGKTSRKTPEELEILGQKFSFDSRPLIYASKMSAKVDNAAVQDSYQLYHHTFIATRPGEWAVIQQGMNPYKLWARRYHWLSSKVLDFVCEPHAGIASDYRLKTLNMVARESSKTREVSACLARERPENLIKTIGKLQTLDLPAEHEVLVKNLRRESLRQIMLKTYEVGPGNFEELLGITGVGPKTIRALALISELIYGAPPSWQDPAKYSFAHGGKDGYPYPVDRQTYEKSIEILRVAVKKAKIEKREKLNALRQLAFKFYDPGS